MKYFVTTPIYYVNARPHIGHVYTTIAADVLARWHRNKGENVLFSTGLDENSQKNVEAAHKAGKETKEYVDEMADVWKTTFQQLGFTHDVFIRTTSDQHRKAVEALLTQIDQAGDIYLGDYEGWYCVGCEAFVAENELVDGKCPIHKTEPERIKEKNYFFRLSKYRDQLLRHYQDNPGFVGPESARNKMLHYIENEMQDISISRQAQEWGIRLPQDKDHAIYVWFDALINYLTVTGYPEDQESFEKFWPADTHLIGKDIIKFHCAIWPAMLLSAGLKLPNKIFAHGFFTIDGQKISKSLGNAINPLELTKDYPIDAIRYYLLREIPFGSDGDFSFERLKERYNSDLANGLGNLVSRTLNMIEKFGDGISFDKQEEKSLGSDLPARVEGCLESFAFDKALASIWEVISQADTLIETKKPWELAKSDKDKGELEDVLSRLYQALTAINASIAPFIPDTHEALKKLLEARPVKKPEQPLFMRKD